MIKNQSNFSLGLVDRNFSFSEGEITDASLSELKGAKVDRTGQVQRYTKTKRSFQYTHVRMPVNRNPRLNNHFALSSLIGETGYNFSLTLETYDNDQNPIYKLIDSDGKIIGFVFKRKDDNANTIGQVFYAKYSDTGTFRTWRNGRGPLTFKYEGVDAASLAKTKAADGTERYIILTEENLPTLVAPSNTLAWGWESRPYLYEPTDDALAHTNNLFKQPFDDFEDSEAYKSILREEGTQINTTATETDLGSRKKHYLRFQYNGTGDPKFEQIGETGQYKVPVKIQLVGVMENSIYKLDPKRQGNYNSTIDNFLAGPEASTESFITVEDLGDVQTTKGVTLRKAKDQNDLLYTFLDGNADNAEADEKAENARKGTITVDTNAKKYSAEGLVGKKLCWSSLDNNRVFICHTSTIKKEVEEVEGEEDKVYYTCDIYVNFAPDLYLKHSRDSTTPILFLTKMYRLFINFFLRAAGTDNTSTGAEFRDSTHRGDPYNTDFYLPASAEDDDTEFIKPPAKNPFDIVGRFVPTSIVKYNTWSEKGNPIRYIQVFDRGCFITNTGYISFSKLRSPFVFHDPVVQIEKFRGFEQNEEGHYNIQDWIVWVQDIKKENTASKAIDLQGNTYTGDADSKALQEARATAKNVYLTLENNGSAKINFKINAANTASGAVDDNTNNVQDTKVAAGGNSAITATADPELSIEISDWKRLENGIVDMKAYLVYKSGNKIHKKVLNMGPLFHNSAETGKYSDTTKYWTTKKRVGSRWRPGGRATLISYHSKRTIKTDTEEAGDREQTLLHFIGLLIPLVRAELLTSQAGNITEGELKNELPKYKRISFNEDFKRSVGSDSGRNPRETNVGPVMFDGDGIKQGNADRNTNSYTGFFKESEDRHGKLKFFLAKDYVRELEGFLSNVVIDEGKQSTGFAPLEPSMGFHNFGYTQMDYVKPPASVVDPFSEQLRLQPEEQLTDIFENEKTLRVLSNLKLYSLTDVGKDTTKLESFIQGGSQFISTEWSGANYILSVDKRNIYRITYSDEKQSHVQNSVTLLLGSLLGGKIRQIHLDRDFEPALLVLGENENLYRVALHENGSFGWSHIGENISSFSMTDEEDTILLNQEGRLFDKLELQTHIISEPEERGGPAKILEVHIYGEFNDIHASVEELYEEDSVDHDDRVDGRKLTNSLKIKRQEGYARLPFEQGAKFRNPVLKITSTDDDCKIFSYSVIYEAHKSTREERA